MRLMNMNRVMAAAVFMGALTACSSPDKASCRQAEGPALIVRLVPTRVSASPADVYGGGSLTMAVALPSGQPIEAVRLSPKGPLTVSDLGTSANQQFLQLHRAGSTTVTATDARGAKFERVVVVHC